MKKISGLRALLFAGAAMALVPMVGQSPALAQDQEVAAEAATPVGPGSLSGIWLNAEYKFTGLPPRDRTIATVDGAAPPLLPEPAALLEKRVVDAERGNVFSNTLSQCLPGGIPMQLFGAAYPIQILETPGQVTMLFEEQNHFRTIILDGVHPEDPDPSFFGSSIGHWEGDTLVVDTIGLKDLTTLDMVGTPHSEALHVVERYRRTGPNQISIRVLIDDPQTFSAPWEAKTTYRPAEAGTQVAEYICENNRNGPDENGHAGFGSN